MNQPIYDFLIVGAGLYGSTFARLATDRGYRCLVIDRRGHAGGNLYCENIGGINVHRYGAHIFHTSNRAVWDFVNSLVEFNRFTNCPIAIAPDGALYNLPFNMTTFHQLWGVVTPAEAVARLDEQRAAVKARMEADGIDSPRNLEEQALMLVGSDIYERLIKGYTEKQWGRPCTALPPSIIRRLPVRLTYDNNYFADLYQGIPKGGYNRLIAAMLAGSDLLTGTDFFADRDRLTTMARKVVFTGRIDEYFGFRFGHLQYRTVSFETETLPVANYQGNAVVNYTSATVPFTRIIEHKHFESFGDEVYSNDHTVISREYSTEWCDGLEPFYPVNDEHNQTIYNQYRQLAENEKDVIFGGRLAEYRYYDMAPIIEQVLNYWDSNKSI